MFGPLLQGLQGQLQEVHHLRRWVLTYNRPG